MPKYPFVHTNGQFACATRRKAVKMGFPNLNSPVVLLGSYFEENWLRVLLCPQYFWVEFTSH